MENKKSAKSLIVGALISSLAFILALAWNSFVQKIINTYITEGEGVIAEAIYVSVITVVTIGGIYVLVYYFGV